MPTAVWLVWLVYLLLLPAPSLGQRDRREVHKKAQPPEGSLSRPGDAKHCAPAPRAGAGKELPRAQFLDVRKLLQLVFSQSNATGQPKSSEPESSRHMDASMAELVAVQTLEGDVAWIEAKFVNESHLASHRRRTRPYTLEEQVALLLPVAVFLVPFVVWICCMLVCIHRSTAGKGSAY